MTGNAKRIAPRGVWSTGMGVTGVSALALAAALAALAPGGAQACTFTPLTNGGVATGVAVSCATENQAFPFATSYGPAAFPPAPTVYTYDGSGADTLSMTGGQVLQATDSPQPPRDSISGETALDARTGTIETGGGADRVDFQAGGIGAAGAPVSVFLGDGANGFAMSGGTLNGSVFGGDDNDAFQLTGGAIAGLIFAGAGGDLVLLDGAVVGGADAAPDAIGLEDGDDTFDMRSGTVNGAVSGNDGDDTLLVSGGTITDFLAGNAGADTILVSGGAVGGGVQGNEGADRITVTGGAAGVVTGDEDDDTIAIEGTAAVEQVLGGAGSDTVTVSGGTVQNGIATDLPASPAGDDAVAVSGGAVGGGIATGGGSDTIGLSGGTVNGDVDAGENGDAVSISGNGTVDGAVVLGGGEDILRFTGGVVSAGILGGAGADTMDMSGGRTTQLAGDEGNDAITVRGDAQVDLVSGGAGSDTVDIAGGAIGGSVLTDLAGGDDEAGADTVRVSGGTVGAGEDGGDIVTFGGDDTVVFTGGVLAGSVRTGTGADTVAVSGDAAIQGAGGNNGVVLEEGDDRFGITGGTVLGFVSGGDGNDQLAIGGGRVGGSVLAGAGDDTVSVSGDATVAAQGGGEAVVLAGGDDRFAMSGGTVAAAVSGGDGDDALAVAGGTLNASLSGDGGSDAIDVSGGRVVGGVFGGDADDAITLSGGTAGTTVDGGAGGDRIALSGTGRVEGTVRGGAGADALAIGGTVTGNVDGDDGNDVVDVSGRAAIGGPVGGGGGDDILTVSGGTLEAGLDGAAGGDRLVVSGGAIGGNVTGGADDDTLFVAGGAVAGGVSAGDGTDRISLSAGSVGGSVAGDGGNDTITLVGPAAVGGSIDGGDGSDSIAVADGTVDGDLDGGSGDDSITVSGGTTGGDVAGGAGDDTVTVVGGTIGGGISAETVQLSGGTIGGDVSGISADTLVIDDSLSAPALDLRDGVAFGGTDAVGTIAATDLAAGGESQNFAGFASLGVSGSTLRFAGSAQGIEALTLGQGSTLFVNGAASLRSGDGGFGSLALGNSTLSLIDGDPTDVLTLGGIALDGATIGLDIDQAAGRADTIVANGAATASGGNTILVNLVGVPETRGVTEIPILSAAGAPLGGTFAVAGISGTPASLFSYQVVQGAAGGLFLRATPNATSVASVTAVDGASASATADNLSDALYAVNNDVARYDLGLAGGAPAPISSSFGVFASGQFARVEHDGFSISDGSGSVAGPSFSSDDFSGAISLDFNAAKYWGFDQEYGLNLGVFGGYASTDVGLDGFGGYDDTGSARNESGMAGAYALIRREVNYLLLSGTVLFGGTEVENGVVGSEGDYDTLGYALTASAGHIFVLGDRTRFDLRGGVLGVSFKGDPYRDSEGLAHDASKVSFGGVKFEPGIYADYAWENGMVFSPYARAELQQRFSYENESGIEGRRFEFDDADFSGAVMAGANLKISESATLSSEVRGKFSSDSSTFAGKLGLKVAF